ncbi:MAG: hypothetical protein P8X74_20675 [Reinekea sp.]
MSDQENTANPNALKLTDNPEALGNRIAQIVASEEPGTILVQWENYPPTPARYQDGLDIRKLIGPENEGREVMITFLTNDITQPVITCILGNVVNDIVQRALTSDPAEESVKSIFRDGETVITATPEQLTLACGKSSLILKANGKVIIKGENIFSRAAESNRIKGGSVDIN